MNNFVKVDFDGKDLLLRVPINNNEIRTLKIMKIMPTYLEVKNDLLYETEILISLYNNKETVTECIRNYSFDDENLQKISRDFVFKSIKLWSNTGYCEEVMITKEVSLKEISLKIESNKKYVVIDLYNDIYIRGGKNKVQLLDVSKDTIYINYEIYLKSDIEKDISMLIKYKNNIEEFIRNNEEIQIIFRKNLCDFSFDKICVHVEMTDDTAIFNTSSSIDEIETLVEKKKLYFYNRMPRFFCDGSPTITCEFDNLEQIHSLLKTPKYLEEHFWDYETLKEEVSNLKLEYVLCGLSITVLLGNYPVGYISQNRGYDINLREIVENFKV